MNKSGHILFAIIFFLIVYIILNENYDLNTYNFIVAFIISMFYALLPDLDLKKSFIRKKIDILIISVIIILSVFYFLGNQEVLIFIAILLGVEAVFTITKHRGVMHSLAFGVIISMPWLLINTAFFIFALSGFISHLIADKL